MGTGRSAAVRQAGSCWAVWLQTGHAALFYRQINDGYEKPKSRISIKREAAFLAVYETSQSLIATIDEQLQAIELFIIRDGLISHKNTLCFSFSAEASFFSLDSKCALETIKEKSKDSAETKIQPAASTRQVAGLAIEGSENMLLRIVVSVIENWDRQPIFLAIEWDLNTNTYSFSAKSLFETKVGSEACFYEDRMEYIDKVSQPLHIPIWLKEGVAILHLPLSCILFVVFITEAVQINTLRHPFAILWASFFPFDSIFYVNLADGSTWIYRVNAMFSPLLIAVLDSLYPERPLVMKNIFLWSLLSVKQLSSEELCVVRGEQQQDDSFICSSWGIKLQFPSVSSQCLATFKVNLSSYFPKVRCKCRVDDTYKPNVSKAETQREACTLHYGAIVMEAAGDCLLFSFIDDWRIFIVSYVPLTAIIPKHAILDGKALDTDKAAEYLFAKGPQQILAMLRRTIDGSKAFWIWRQHWIFVLFFGKEEVFMDAYCSNEILWIVTSEHIYCYKNSGDALLFVGSCPAPLSRFLTSCCLVREQLLMVVKDKGLFLAEITNFKMPPKIRNIESNDASVLAFLTEKIATNSILWPPSEDHERIGMHVSKNSMDLLVMDKKNEIKVLSYNVSLPGGCDGGEAHKKIEWTMGTSVLGAISFCIGSPLATIYLWKYEIPSSTFVGRPICISSGVGIYCSMPFSRPLLVREKKTFQWIMTTKIEDVVVEGEIVAAADQGLLCIRTSELKLIQLEQNAENEREEWKIAKILSWQPIFGSFANYVTCFLNSLLCQVTTETSLWQALVASKASCTTVPEKTSYNELFEPPSVLHRDTANGEEEEDMFRKGLSCSDEDVALASRLNTRASIHEATLVEWIELCKNLVKNHSSIDDDGKLYLAWASALVIAEEKDELEKLRWEIVQVGKCCMTPVNELLLTMIKLVGNRLTLDIYLQAGFPFLFQNQAANRYQEESFTLGKHMLAKEGNDPRNPLINLLFVAGQKRKLLASLWKRGGSSSSFSKKLCQLYEDTCGETKEIALKNAFVCMSKHEHGFAATLFIIGEDHKAAVRCAEKVSLELSYLIAGALGETQLQNNISLQWPSSESRLQAFVDEMDAGSFPLHRLALMKHKELEFPRLHQWIKPFRRLVNAPEACVQLMDMLFAPS